MCSCTDPANTIFMSNLYISENWIIEDFRREFVENLLKEGIEYYGIYMAYDLRKKSLWASG